MNEYRQDVYTLQMWLSALHCAGEKIPAIAPTGYYNEITAATVRAFQQLHGMDPTGVVDLETWNAVRDAYSAMCMSRAEPDGARIFPSPTYVLTIGEKSDLALCVQMILEALCVAYDDFDDIAQSGIYDERTAEAIRKFQLINGLEPTGNVDKTTWDRLVRNYNVFANHPGYVC